MGRQRTDHAVDLDRLTVEITARDLKVFAPSALLRAVAAAATAPSRGT